MSHIEYRITNYCTLHLAFFFSIMQS